MPIISLGIGTEKTIYLDTVVFNQEELKMLKNIGCHIIQDMSQANDDGVIVKMEKDDISFEDQKKDCDCIIGDHLLYLVSPKVDPEDILTVRKRMATPLTTPVAENKLLEIAGMKLNNIQVSTPEAIADYKSQLQTLCGTKSLVDPITFSAGLPALSSLFATLINRGGCDMFMASTAYGGSSQLVDLYSEHSNGNKIRKHKFDIQGKTGMIDSIRSKLELFSEQQSLDGDNSLPTTVLFVEIPTNPDMKVPNIEELAMLLSQYGEKTGKSTMLLVDSTFAPGSEIMDKLKTIVPDLNVMVFISLSKSISRGMTTAGTLVGNHTLESAELMKDIAVVAQTLDTLAKDDQMNFLTNNIDGVKQRCLDAYQMAKDAGDVIVDSVKEVTGQTMELAFVTPEEAAQGFTTSTFSFNLPAVSHLKDSEKINRSLAQNFVDLLTNDKRFFFKPCVSFGQDNGIVYATVPATSTQGAISDEDKNKQEVGGVQLTRLSFPPTLSDEKAVHDLLRQAVVSLYSNLESQE
jgi:cysteine synthase A